MKATIGNLTIDVTSPKEIGAYVRDESYDHVKLEQDILIEISLDFKQTKERTSVKEAGFKWNPETKVWYKMTNFIPRNVAELL